MAHRSSSGKSAIRDPVADRTYTTKARRSDILQAAGEAPSEANQPTASSQDTVRKFHKVAN